jgi:hypothetical protein
VSDEVRFRIDPGNDFARVAAALREVDVRLPGQLRRSMKNTVQPFVAEAKNKVRSLPVLGHAGHTGLRRRVARGVRLTAGTGRRDGAYLRVITSVADSKEAAIPRGLDSARGWRHPVFGNRDEWVTQHALRPGWFTETFQNARRPIVEGLENVLEDARDTVARAGRL